MMGYGGGGGSFNNGSNPFFQVNSIKQDGFVIIQLLQATSCMAGYYLSNGACVACSVNQYSFANSTSCQNCINSFTNGPGSASCTCSAGYIPISVNNQFQCSPCPAGSFKSASGTGTCSICPVNTFSTAGSTQCTSCGNYAVSPPNSTECLCLAGYHLTNTGCSPCWAGSYKTMEGNAPCTPCDAGTYSFVSGSNLADYCQGCSAGTISLGNTSFCTNCPIDKYSLPRSSLCIDCGATATTNSLSGSSSCVCKRGYQPSGTLCIPCSAGYFKTTSGNLTCSQCSPGTFQSTIGQTTCTGCSAGTFQAAFGKTSCELCPGGSYSSSINATSPSVCQKCPVNTFSNATGAQSNSACIACHPNATTNGLDGRSQPSACMCKEGFQGDGVTTCSPCPVNAYKASPSDAVCSSCGIGATTNGKTGSSVCYCPEDTYGDPRYNCTICPDSKFKVGLTSAITFVTDCGAERQCLPGYYGDPSASCMNCPQNTYRSGNAVSVTTRDDCLSCPAGSVTLVTAAGSISDCLCMAGYFSIGGSNCFVCPVNTYKTSTTNSAVCTNCPENSSTSGATNSTSIAACSCNPGFAGKPETGCILCGPNSSPIPGSSSCQCNAGYYPQNNNTCAPCQPGTYKTNPGNSSCDACGVNTFSSVFNATSSASCRPCPVGFTTNETMGAFSCYACDLKNGYIGTAPNCRTCEFPLAFSEQTLNCGCKEGFGMSPGSTLCTACARNFYKASVGNDSCIACPNGRGTLELNSSACNLVLRSNTPPEIAADLIPTTFDLAEDGRILINITARDNNTDNILTFYIVGLPSNGILRRYLGPSIVESGEVLNLDSAIPNYRINLETTLEAKANVSSTVSLYYVPTQNFFGTDSFEVYVDDNVGLQTEPIKVNVTIASVNDAPVFNLTELVVKVPAGSLTVGKHTFSFSAFDVDEMDAIHLRIVNMSVLPRHLDVIRTPLNEKHIGIEFSANGELRQIVEANAPFINSTGDASEWFAMPVPQDSHFNGEFRIDAVVNFGASGGSPNPILVMFIEVKDSGGLIAPMLLKIKLEVACPSGKVPNVWAQGGLCLECPTGGVCHANGNALPYNTNGYAASGEAGVFLPCAVESACPQRQNSEAIEITFVPEKTVIAFEVNNQIIYSNSLDAKTSLSQMASLGTTCANGYAGDRCSDCQTGFYRKKGGMCEKCSPNALNFGVFLAIGVISLLAGISLLVFISKIPNLDTGNIGIGVAFFQVLATFNDIPKIDWPDISSNVLKLASALNFELELVAPECIVQSTFVWSYELKLQIILALPIVVTGLVIFMFCARALFEFILQKAFPALAQKWSAKPMVEEHMPILQPVANSVQNTRMSRASGVAVGTSIVYYPTMSPTGAIMVTPVAYNSVIPNPAYRNANGEIVYQQEMQSPNSSAPQHGNVYNFGVRLVGIWLSILNVLYLTLVIKSVEIFNCVRIAPGISYVAAEPSIKCESETWARLHPFAVLGILLYALGILILFGLYHIITYSFDETLEFPPIFSMFSDNTKQRIKHYCDKIVNIRKEARKLRQGNGKMGDDGGDEELYRLLGLVDSHGNVNKPKKPEINSKFVQFIVDVSRHSRSSFTNNYRYWDIVSLVRKLLISLGTTFIVGSVQKCLALLVILSIAVHLQLKTRPYTKPNWNRLEEVLMFGLQLILIAAVTFYNGYAESGSIRNALGIAVILIVVFNTALIIGLSLVEIRNCFKYWKVLKAIEKGQKGKGNTRYMDINNVAKTALVTQTQSAAATQMRRAWSIDATGMQAATLMSQSPVSPLSQSIPTAYAMGQPLQTGAYYGGEGDVMVSRMM